MSVGEGCLKKGRTITSPKGVEGHMVFGPYARLAAGDYVVAVGISVADLEKNPAAPALVLEIVVDEKVIDTLEIPLGNEGAIAWERAFVIDAAHAMQPIQLRLWVPGQVEVTLDAVTVTRLPRTFDWQAGRTSCWRPSFWTSRFKD